MSIFFKNMTNCLTGNDLLFCIVWLIIWCQLKYHTLSPSLVTSLPLFSWYPETFSYSTNTCMARSDFLRSVATLWVVGWQWNRAPSPSPTVSCQLSAVNENHYPVKLLSAMAQWVKHHYTPSMIGRHICLYHFLGSYTFTTAGINHYSINRCGVSHIVTFSKYTYFSVTQPDVMISYVTGIYPLFCYCQQSKLGVH